MLSSDTVVDIESVRCFLAAATHLNFRVAARAMNFSPAAFGQRIARLEADLGVSLFQRTTRKIELTPAGERAVPAARSLLDSATELRHAVLDAETPRPFELTIGTRFELGLSWLTPSLSLLAALQPQRTLHLSFGDSTELLDRVARELIDAAITSARTVPSKSQFVVIHPEDYVLVCAGRSKQYPESISPSDTPNYVLLDLRPDLPLFDYLLRAQDGSTPWQFRRVEFLGTIGAIRIRTIEGAGIAVLPRYFVAKDLDDGALVELGHPGVLHEDAFRLVWRADHPRQDDLNRLGSDLRGIPLR